MRLFYKSILVYGLVFVALVFASLTQAQATERKNAESVTIQLKWFHQFQFAGYYAAIEQGFYAEEGLNVALRERDLESYSVNDVLSGKAQYGVSDSGLLLSRFSKKPVVLLAQIFQHSPLVFLTPRRSGIRTPFDLIGKSVMISPDTHKNPSLNALILKTLGGFDKLKRVDETFRNQDIIDGKADVTSAYLTAQPYWFREQGVAVNVIDPRDYGIDFYGDNLFTTESEVRDHPERVAALTRATLKGWEYALAHKDEIVDLILREYNTQGLSRELLLFEAEETAKVIASRFIPLGQVEQSRYQKIAETHVNLGLADSSGIDKEFFYRNQETAIELTADEKAWIKANPVVRLGIDPAWPPFEWFDEEGRYQGMSSEYIEQIELLTGLKIEAVPGLSWSQVVSGLQDGSLDMSAALTFSEKRSEFLSFTRPFSAYPAVLMVRKGSSAPTSLEKYRGRKVGTGRGYVFQEFIEKQYPEVDLVLFDSPDGGLTALAVGEIEGYVGNLGVLSYVVQENSLLNLEVAGRAKGLDKTELRMAARKDLPDLASILDKALAAIPEEIQREIARNWVKVEIPASEVANRPDAIVELSAAERQWITEHPTIRISGDPDWLPMEAFTDQGKYIGMVPDYLRLIEQRLGVDFEIVPTRTWSESMDLAKTGQVDLLSAMDTSARREFLRFTKPYLDLPVVIMVQRDSPGVSNPEQLRGKTIAVPRGYAFVRHVEKRFGGAEVIQLETVKDCIIAVASGEADALISTFASTSYQIDKFGLSNLKVAGSVGISVALGLGVRKDWGELVSLLDRALASISEEERIAIRHRWIPDADEDQIAIAVPDRRSRLFMFGLVAGIMLLLTIAAWIAPRLVSDRFTDRLRASGVRAIVIVAMALFLTVVVVGAFWGMQEVERRYRESIGETLRVAVETTHDTLRAWVQMEKEDIETFSRDSELLPLVRGLLAVPRYRDTLLTSEALADVRDYFHARGSTSGYQGFFVIAPDYTNVGSMRDTNIGWRNLIAERRPESLKRAFEGETTLVLPVRSDVALPDAEGSMQDAQATMFVASPVIDEKGTVIAVITLRSDPERSFSQLCMSGRIGLSGETFAFDASGMLLSHSRFEDALRTADLIREEQQDILNVRISDPGGNLLEGFRPITLASERPLTYSAAEATAGRSGVNVRGYNDYRGVRALGAWVWDEDLGLGLASEIDEVEALAAFNVNRRIVFSILGLTVTLALLLAGFVIWSGQRASRDLLKARDEWELLAADRTAELRKRERKFRAIFDQIVQLMALLDTQGNVLEVNRAALTLGNIEEQEVLGRSFWECPWWTHSADLQQELREAVQQAHDGKFVRFEARHYTAAGEERIIDVSLSPVVDEDGTLMFLLPMGNDITEMRRAETAIMENEKKFRGLFETSRDAIFILDQTGVLDCNAEALRLFGAANKDALLGLQPYDLSPPRQSDSRLSSEVAQENIDRAMSEGHAFFEYLHTSLDGTEFLCEVLLNQAEWDSRPAVQSVVRNITERKQASDAVIRRAHLAEGLQEAGQRIALCQSVKELTETLVRVSVEQLGLTCSWIGVVDEIDSVRPVAAHGMALERLRNSSCTCPRTVVKNGKVIVNKDINGDSPGDKCTDFVRECGFASCATFPIVVAGEMLATYTIYSDEAGEQSIVAHTVHLVESLVRQVGYVWERCLAEEDMRKLSSAVEQSPVVVVITDTSDSIKYVNPRFTEVTGYTADEALGQNPQILLAEGMNPPELYSELWDTLRAGKRWQGEFCNRRKDGSLFWESASISPIRNSEGEITHFVAVKEDISERKKIQEELRKHTSELERFNKAMIGREKRSIELKREVNQLCRELNREPPYTKSTNETES
jgi:PAS domain S-box-containing protein